MELRQLEYFIAVAEEANFTEQPSASTSVSPGSAPGPAARTRSWCDAHRPIGPYGHIDGCRAAALVPARSVLASVDAVRHAVDEVNGLIQGRLVSA